MRLVLLALRNLFALLFLLPGLPFRWARSRKRPEYVRLRLKEDPPYRASGRRPFPFWRRPEPATVTSVEMLEKMLEVLGTARRVKGVFFELESFTAPLAKRAAIAKLFERFRGHGKELVGYAVTASNGEYELLCSADRIWMPTAGRLELLGFAAEPTVLGAGLRQLGVKAHFIRRGDHKTAPEMFTDEVISPIQRQTIEVMLDERHSELVDTLSRCRALTPEQARQRIDAGPYSAQRATAQGLIDAMVSRAEVKRKLGVEGRKASMGHYREYRRTFAFPPGSFRSLARRPRLAVVSLKGMITHGTGGRGPMLAQVAGSDAIARCLRAAGRDRRCSAVVLHIDSPGGSALGSELILEEVKRTATKKPVIAFVDVVAASGGYMAALGAMEFWAAPHAIVGSIGVFGGKFELSTLLRRLGVHRELITRGANAGLYSPQRGFTDSERTSLEADIEETYQAFLAHVATARGKTVEEIHARAEGRIYSGTRAVEQGLVDRTGLFEDACRRALELASKPGKDFEITHYSTPTPRLPLLAFLQRQSQAGIYTLWYPWLRIHGD